MEKTKKKNNKRKPYDGPKHPRNDLMARQMEQLGFKRKVKTNTNKKK